MGNSAQATLFYGYVFNKENTWPWEDEDDYERWESFRDRDWEFRDFYIHFFLGKTEEEVDAMGYEEKAELFKPCMVEVEDWGYLYEQSCYFICPKDKRAKYTCWWESPQSINPKDMDPEAEWDEVLKKFAEKMGIDLKGQEPGWHMVASYG